MGIYYVSPPRVKKEILFSVRIPFGVSVGVSVTFFVAGYLRNRWIGSSETCQVTETSIGADYVLCTRPFFQGQLRCGAGVVDIVKFNNMYVLLQFSLLHLRKAFVKVTKVNTICKQWRDFAQGPSVSDQEIQKIEEKGGSGRYILDIRQFIFDIWRLWKPLQKSILEYTARYSR